MLTQIKTVGRLNGIKYSGKVYPLSDLIQESYAVNYKARKSNVPVLMKLAEGHLLNVKNDPTNTASLSEGLDILKGLLNLGSKVKIVESQKPKKTPKRVSESVSWESSKKSLNEGLKNFRESSKSKLFFKELAKFNSSMSSKKSLSLSEAVTLYKAANSCLTHLTVELEKNPDFLGTYGLCTKLLTSDTNKLLESIQTNSSPSRNVLSNFVKFTNILLESDTSSDDLEDIEEDDDILAVDDQNVIDTDSETSAEDPDVAVDLSPDEIKVLKSILSKISSMDESDDLVADEEVVADQDDSETSDIDSEDSLEDDESDEDIDEDEEVVDDDYLEDEDTSEDEEVVDDVNEDEDVDTDYEDDEDEDPSLDEDEDTSEDEEVADLRNKLEGLRKSIDEILNPSTDAEDSEEISEGEESVPEEDSDDVVEESEDDDTEEEVLDEDEDPAADSEESSDDEDDKQDFELGISESAINRIKKCF